MIYRLKKYNIGPFIQINTLSLQLDNRKTFTNYIFKKHFGKKYPEHKNTKQGKKTADQ